MGQIHEEFIKGCNCLDSFGRQTFDITFVP